MLNNIGKNYVRSFFVGKPPLFPLLTKEGCRGGLDLSNPSKLVELSVRRPRTASADKLVYLLRC